jgi:hypothetical protein
MWQLLFLLVKLKILLSPPWLGWPLCNIYVTNDHGYVPLVANTFHYSRLIIGFVTRLTRRVALVQQELLTISVHLSSPPVFSGIRVTRSLVLYECFVDRCLSFCTFSFGHCVVYSSSIYGFWLPLWYLQALLVCLEHESQYKNIFFKCTGIMKYVWLIRHYLNFLVWHSFISVQYSNPGSRND